ncbi:MAG: class I SAM-dependent methyltransferase [Kofleriaceae bacterium]|nr:MAG: class I SAM-dependent methyltransferase [Kofleriaceae bacterium]MBZ0233140.1 class I SAM-dependent methyltransferase [Kofleriaceae bacterium]
MVSSASAAEQEAFLVDFHGRFPGVTARALARGGSYAALVGALRLGLAPLGLAQGERGGIADLGCGDGYLLAELRRAGFTGALVGIDLSAAELRAASARATNAHLVQARAQALPLRARSLDVVVSHLAFTLMAEIDAVVAELGRVIAPGGHFIAVVGGGPRGEDAFAGFLELARPFVRGVPRLGEIRARSDRGLAELFAAGWTELTIDDLPCDLSGTPDEVWESMATVYDLARTSAHERAELRERFVRAMDQWCRDDGSVACTMATRLVRVRRGG